MERDLVSAGYDAVYASAMTSATMRRIWHDLAEGPDFPEEFGHISFTTLPELRKIKYHLALGHGDRLLDLGCGLAGPALWMARETGAHLTGVDLSPVAIKAAGERAAELGLDGQAEFRVGSFADTGLEGNSIDGAMSEDALQYAPDKLAAFKEIARILRPGGRFVFTTYEIDRDRAADLPILSVDRVEDYEPVLGAAGFEVRLYEEAPGWPEPMTATYSVLLDARGPLTEEMGEAAVGVLFTELSMTLEQKPYRRRVLAVAAKS